MIKCETPDIKSRNTEGQTRYFLLRTGSISDPVTDPVSSPVKKTVSGTGSISDPQTDPVLQEKPETGSISDPVTDPNTILIDNTILSNNTVLSNIPNTNVFGQEKKPESPKKEKGKEEKKPSAQKKEESTPHWQTLVDTWFLFYEGKFNHKPSFSGSDPRDFKNILSRLQTRAAMKGMEWTEQHAAATLNMFLDVAIEDKWLNSNFLLSNLSRQFDKIVTYANSKANGETGRGTFQSALQKLNLLYPDD
ncbi:hypothetical protein VF03_30270 [Nostoc linckia z2]|nr:hypothetical protein VF03_30270 [Nostoc linckia z2]